MGEAPPYEAFCMGGTNSIRGWYDCDLAVSKAFSELTLEYLSLIHISEPTRPY